MKIKLIKFDNYDKAPFRAHYNDAGADVYSTQDILLEPHTTIKIPLGFGLELPDGFMACIFPRSSCSSKGLVAQLPPIDSGYRGEVHAIITNSTDNQYMINKDDKIGQIVVIPIILCDFVEELGNERGTGAFGSTNKIK